MKKSNEIISHVILWVLVFLMVVTFCKLYIQANPDSQLALRVNYVVFLEMIMGLIFFYTTFFGLRLVRGKQAILAAVLVVLLLVFAYPAMRHGFWQVMSSVIPHVAFISLAVIFRELSGNVKLTPDNQTLQPAK